MSPTWAFPRNDADEDEGLANAGIEIFRDAPYSGIARECGQNSLDAVFIDDESGQASQVVLAFTKREATVDSIPSVDQLRRSIAWCLKRAKARNDEKELEFFYRASGLLKQPLVGVLHISDEGTVGLRGPCQQGTPYHALVKASGVSEKNDKSSGGSFGIGKNAAYAVSSLRTVFYSTIYQTKSTGEFLAQGKSILVSHEGDDGTPYRAAGYWGEAKFQPVHVVNNLPDWLTREVRGTTVAALGFEGGEDWQFQITESLIRNFFAAVEIGAIAFNVDNEIMIDKFTLHDLFGNEKIMRAAERNGFGEDLSFSSDLYKCLVSPETHRHEKAIEGLGTIRLHLLVEEGLEKRVALLRNGMYITDSLQHFGEKFSRFALQKDFVAVIEPADKKTGAVIRSLENPRHDELSPERLEDKQKQREIKAAFRRLISWVREVIKSETTSTPQEEIILDEMNQFFASPKSRDKMPNSESEDDDPETSVFKPLKVREPAGRSSLDGSEGGSGGETPSKTKGGRTSGRGQGAGEGGTGKRGDNLVPLVGFRNLVPAGDSRRHRKIFFTPKASGQARIDILATGMAERTTLPIRSIDGIAVENRKAFITLTSDQRVTCQIEIFTNYEGPIELNLTLVEGGRHEDQ